MDTTALAKRNIINSNHNFGAYQVTFLAVGLLIATSAVLAAAPFIAPSDDEKNFGPPEKALFWTPEQQVAGYRNMDKIFPTRRIKGGASPLLLPYAKADLANVQIRHDAGVMTADEYLKKIS